MKKIYILLMLGVLFSFTSVFADVSVTSDTEYILNDLNISVQFDSTYTFSQIILYNDSITLGSFRMTPINELNVRTNLTVTSWTNNLLSVNVIGEGANNFNWTFSPIPYSVPPTGTTRTVSVTYNGTTIDNDGVFNTDVATATQTLILSTEDSTEYCGTNIIALNQFITFLPLIVTVFFLTIVLYVVNLMKGDSRSLKDGLKEMYPFVMTIISVGVLVAIGIIILVNISKSICYEVYK